MRGCRGSCMANVPRFAFRKRGNGLPVPSCSRASWLGPDTQALGGVASRRDTAAPCALAR